MAIYSLVNMFKKVLLGEFVNDKASGYGIYFNTNGSYYNGDWIDDYQEGLG